MKAYGLARIAAGDCDATGCAANGRATRVYALAGRGGDARAYRALRGGAKAAVRRPAKRAARAEGRAACRDTD
jgi:hypothetical protein